MHAELRAEFGGLNGLEIVSHYGDTGAEDAALAGSVGVLDLSFRSRLCLLGADRVKFLNGQVTNNVAALRTGEGCYAALVTAKGRMQSDLHIFALEDELLLDFEPGLGADVAARLEKYIIADDVQIVDAAPHYGLLSIQGPRAADALTLLDLGCAPPARAHDFATIASPALGRLYLMNLPRTTEAGFDLFVPADALAMTFDKLVAAAKSLGGRACGWDALDAARIEAGIPRFGADMDDTHLPPEAGLESTAISYTKGCYIGQEVIARLRTYGNVAKALRTLHLPAGATAPRRGEKLFKDGREVGQITSAVVSRRLGFPIALGYVRRECNALGTELTLQTTAGATPVKIAGPPTRKA
jgi:folate-binding protein YgfZ